MKIMLFKMLSILYAASCSSAKLFDFIILGNKMWNQRKFYYVIIAKVMYAMKFATELKKRKLNIRHNFLPSEYDSTICWQIY